MAQSETVTPDPVAVAYGNVLRSEHRAPDDLLSAGLGLAGLRSAQAPVFADPAAPTASEIRRRAMYQSWRGIADLRPGGFGDGFASLQPVPGREWRTLLRLPGARHPHLALVQIPDAFDPHLRCLIVTASSGSRGIYGALAVAGGFGLPKGCAVVYTDKGAGSGVFDFASDTGTTLDGTRAARGKHELEFEPEPGGTGVAYKHAHSGDFPDGHWGHHVLQALDFGLATLNEALPQHAPFTADNTRILAVGLSNGGGAVLRAAELARPGLIDAVVAAAPNVTVPGIPPLLVYASQAALLQPCAMHALRTTHGAALPRINPWFADPAPARCERLRGLGWIAGETLSERSLSALDRLRSLGFRDSSMLGAASNVELDLWRYVLATYLQSYQRVGTGAPACGYRFAVPSGNGTDAPVSIEQRALWSSDFSGLAPSAGIALLEPEQATALAPEDPSFAGLLCAYQAIHGGADKMNAAVAQGLSSALEQTLAQPERLKVPTLLVHGTHDALIPFEFTSEPYFLAAQQAGARIALRPVAQAQHFDAFLAFPTFSAAFVPLLPEMYRAMSDSLESISNPGAADPYAAR